MRGGRLLALSAGGVAQAAANAGAALIATAVLGAEQRGIMVLAITISGFVGLVGGLGTGAALRSSLPGAPPDRRAQLLSAYAWCSVAAPVVAASAAVLVSAVSAPAVDDALASRPVLVAVALYGAAITMLWQLVELWFAEGRFQGGSAWGAAMASGGAVAVLAAAPRADTAAAMLLAQATGTFAIGLVAAVATRRAGLLAIERLRPGDVRQLVVIGAPTVGLTLGLSIVVRVDRYLIGVAAGPAAVAVYSLAATFSEVPRLVPAAIGQVLLRDVATAGRRQAATTACAAAVAAAAVVALAVAAIGAAVVVPLFGPEFSGARPLLLVLLVAEVCFAPYAVAARGLVGGGWTRAAGALGVWGAVAATTAYAVCAYSTGALGVAVASVAVYAVHSWGAWSMLRRRLARRELTLAR